MKVKEDAIRRIEELALPALGVALIWVCAGFVLAGLEAREPGATLWSNDTVGRLESTMTTPPADAMARVGGAFDKLPLRFETNDGQTDPEVKFTSRGRGYTVFLTDGEAVLALQEAVPASANRASGAEAVRGDIRDVNAIVHPAVVRIRLMDANPQAKAAGRKELPGRVNHIIGNDPRRWRTNVLTYAEVAYDDIYPDIDLIYYGNQNQLEYDFVVGAAADPKVISIAFQGVDALDIDANGDLVLDIRGKKLHQRAPKIYQEVDGARESIAGGYEIRAAQEVGFRMGVYDQTRPLIIDPVLEYSSYLGGSEFDVVTGVAVDTLGNLYVSGLTGSSDFPTTPDAFDTTYSGNFNAVVTKIDVTGTSLVYSTYIGPVFGQNVAIAVDGDGSAYVTGSTSSSDFPTTPGAFATALNVGPNGGLDSFVIKLAPNGSTLVYSTFLGGTDLNDNTNDIAVNGGIAFVTGYTDSADFPTTPGAFDTVPTGSQEAFVTAFSPDGSALVYSTYLGGDSLDEGRSIAVDGGGNSYVTGRTSGSGFPTTPSAFDTTHNGGFDDAFVAKLNSSGSALVYSTYLGGSSGDLGGGISVSGDGSAYVVGLTQSSDFPTTPGVFGVTFGGGAGDFFVTRLDPSGSALVYSTYLGGSGQDGIQEFAVAVNSQGSAYVTGVTLSSDFPITSDAFDTTWNGGIDAFVTQIDPSGSQLIYSTYLGGPSSGGLSATLSKGIAVDGAGSMYVAGLTTASDFPTTPGAFDTTLSGFSDGFATKISAAPPTPSELLRQLILDVENLNLPQGRETSLLAQLSSAVARIENPFADDAAAIGALEAFANYLRSVPVLVDVEGQPIPEARREALIAAAQEIAELLRV